MSTDTEPATVCAWVESCPNTATHTVEHRIRDGLAVVADICDLHLPSAALLGYQAERGEEPARRTGRGRVTDGPWAYRQ